MAGYSGSVRGVIRFTGSELSDMKLEVAAMQAGAIAWGALGLASTLLAAPVLLTILIVGLAGLTQLMVFGAAGKGRATT